MITIIVFNPADVPVTDYPIENPQTKEVHLWSIKQGETLDFPDYVGEYLTEVYHFLQRVVTKKDRELELEEAEKLRKGKHFDRIKVVDAVDSLKQPKTAKVPRPETLEGFTSKEVLGGEQPAPRQPSQIEQPKQAKADKPAASEMSGAVQSPAPKAQSQPATKPDLGEPI